MKEYALEVASKNIVEFENTVNAEKRIKSNMDLINVFLKAYMSTDATHKIGRGCLVIDNVGWFTKCTSMLPIQVIGMYYTSHYYI